MMLVASIALGTSTYAWFINNRTVEVETMQLEVSTSSSMLVAVGKKPIEGEVKSTAWTGFKSTITNSDITGATGTDVADWTNMLTNQLTPASTSNRSLASAKPSFFATDNHVTGGKLDHFDLLPFDFKATGVGMGTVKRIPLKFTSSSNIDVYFGKEADANGMSDLISALTITEVTGKPTWAAQAAGIKQVLRVAVVPQQDGDAYTAAVKPLVFQFDAGTTTDGALSNTDYSGVLAKENVFVSDADDTTSSTVDVTAAIKELQNETTGKYAAIKEVDGTKKITNVQLLQARLPADGKSWATVATKDGSLEITAPVAAPEPLFQLAADKPREVDIYIWLEGTDDQCVNALSAYKFGLHLPFAAVETPLAP